MYIDAQNLLSDSQAFTASGASTNYIDLSSDRDIGVGEPLAVVITVEVAADVASTDETYAFAVQADDNSSFSSPRDVISRSFTTAQATTELAINKKVVFLLPADDLTERYLRLYATLGGTTPSITISAWLAPASFVQNDKYFADAITIS